MDVASVPEVFEMVDKTDAALLGFLTLLVSPLAFGKAPEVTQARIAAHSDLTIKPCQQVSVVLELDLSPAADADAASRIVRDLSHVVRINGREFTNPSVDTSSLNPVAWFECPLISRRRRGQKTVPARRTLTVVATLFVDLPDRRYLFRDPGAYEVEFLAAGKRLSINVQVSPPSATELEVISALQPQEITLFLFDPSDPQHATPAVLEHVKQLASRDTHYRRWLSMAYGVGLATSSLHVDPASTKFESARRQRAAEVVQWLAPVCDGRISTPLEALATYHYGLNAGMATLLEEEPARKSALLRERARAWRAVSDSPFAVGDAVLASEYLKQVESKASAKPTNDNGG
jgi:hypothetical protein